VDFSEIAELVGIPLNALSRRTRAASVPPVWRGFQSGEAFSFAWRNQGANLGVQSPSWKPVPATNQPH
jgi:hypothetical protein